MNHLAIDLGSRKSQVCMRNERGEILQEYSCPTLRLQRMLDADPAHVVLETSAEAFTVARAAQALGHQVTVVPSVLARTLGVAQRGVKTDVRDARALSLVACQVEKLPSVHIPSQRASEWRALSTSRETLLDARTQLVNSVRGFLRTLIQQPLRCTPKTLPARVRAALRDDGSGVPMHIERLLVCIETMNEQAAEMDRELSELASQEPTCRLLMSMPGVGPVTATRFVAALDDPKRFDSAASVMGYLGLTPGEKSSGQSQRRTGLTKAGPAPVRRVLNQAAWCFLRVRADDPIGQWAVAVAQRRGKMTAVTALARKMAGVLFAMWRDHKPYDPQHQLSSGNA